MASTKHRLLAAETLKYFRFKSREEHEDAVEAVAQLLDKVTTPAAPEQKELDL